MTIHQKTPEEIEKIAAAGRVLARCHRLMRSKARTGVTTGELDQAAEKFIRSQGGWPVFKGYRGFPGSICASPNSMVVHGIPGKYRLERGDILSIDIGVELDGWVADAAVTLPIGNVSPVAKKLLASTRGALFDAVEQCRVGNQLGDISHAVQQRVERDGFSVIRSLVGHGIGRDMHEDPQIPNFGEPGTGPTLEEGMVFAIEPMVNAGDHPVRMGSDNWAVYSRDGSLTAHFEHTVAITAEGPRILTPWHLDDGQPVPAAERAAASVRGR
jgi:methionyl aminopeptidase